MELQLKQVRLSVVTCKHMSPELRSVRRHMGLNSLVRLENAQVKLYPYMRLHLFDTARCLWDAVIKHYTEVRLIVLLVFVLFIKLFNSFYA